MEKIQYIRQLEKNIESNAKETNSIITIRKIIRNLEESKDVKVAAIHSLRRLFINFIEDGVFAQSKQSEKKAVYTNWLKLQLNEFIESLLSIIATDPADVNGITVSALSIRTLLELVKREHMFLGTSPTTPTNPTQSRFGASTFKALISTIVKSDSEVDADLLLMLREEVFSKHDCLFYSLLLAKDIIDEVKELTTKGQHSTTPSSSSSSSSSSDGKNGPLNTVVVTKNLLDFLRMASMPTAVDTDSFLMDQLDDTINSDGDAHSDYSSDEETALRREEEALRPQGKDGKKRQRMEALHASNALLAAATQGDVDSRSQKKKGKGATHANKKKKKKSGMTVGEQVRHLSAYTKIFSQAWIGLLSLPLSQAQHKVILKHLPDHVMPVMVKPLLLADYLTASYDKGTGVVSVLALESLFQLIVNYNLDHPKFFDSLYRMCNVEVFSAKYRHKFMRLLSQSLRSTNLPAYLVAAFVKRLAFLALHTPTPNTQFLIKQVAWLLQHHPQCQVLLHRPFSTSKTNDRSGSKSKSKSKSTDNAPRFFENYAASSRRPESSDALQSSLWELTVLEHHHLAEVATDARTVKENPLSTERGKGGQFNATEQHTDSTFLSLVERELQVLGKEGKGHAKKDAPRKRRREGANEMGLGELAGAALAYKEPPGLFVSGVSGTGGDSLGGSDSLGGGDSDSYVGRDGALQMSTGSFNAIVGRCFGY